MVKSRKPYQGVINILCFNWHYYAIALLGIILMYWLNLTFHLNFYLPVLIASIFILFSISVSLIVSHYVYDKSNLYDLSWLDRLSLSPAVVVNIHAGFDETSEPISQKYPNAELHILDFYDAQKHTEISISRARMAYPNHANTITVATGNLPLQSNSIDVVFVMLSAHEIRNESERILFYNELKRILKMGGRIVMVEHLRDLSNFAAFTFGYFHFYSESLWLKNFKEAGLQVYETFKITPFLSTFILIEDDTTP